MEYLDADVVVIGSGPCGAIVANQLAQKGYDATLVEQGDWVDFPSLQESITNNPELSEEYLSANPNLRKWLCDDPVDDCESPIKPMIGNAVGGGSGWWSSHIPRFRPDDFRTNTIDGVGQDWPLSYTELAPYYDRVEELWGVASVIGDPSADLQRKSPVFQMPSIGTHGHRISDAFDRLGWHWWPVDLVVGNLSRCEKKSCNHIGPCDLGCQNRSHSNAKKFVEQAVKSGVRLLTNTKVMKLEIGKGDLIKNAVCHQRDSLLRLSAKNFILAAGGMGTPRLLLLSACEAYPNGLANNSGFVGRNLMLHPYANVDGRFTNPLGAWANHEMAGIISLQFQTSNITNSAKRGFKLQLNPGPSPSEIARGIPSGRQLPWGANHLASFTTYFDHICGLTVCVEDLPDKENRITLSEKETDKFGMPAAKWIYQLSENSKLLLDFGIRKAKEVMIEAGAVETFENRLKNQAGFHIMGTTGMGVDSMRSVTNPLGQCHDHKNLFVADSSLFVTASCLNPTLTAQALALRLVDSNF